jgi:DNA-binding response OmpR family regulator
MHNKMEMVEPGDQTAMICLESPEMQRIAIEQLGEHGYKVHTGFSLEDILLKLRAQTYDLLLVSDDFGGSKSAAENPVLREAIHQSASQRHKQFIVLVGPYATNDELQAFEQSVDLVIGQSDFIHLRPRLRRGLSRTHEFYAPYQEVLQAAGKA